MSFTNQTKKKTQKEKEKNPLPLSTSLFERSLSLKDWSKPNQTTDLSSKWVLSIFTKPCCLLSKTLIFFTFFPRFQNDKNRWALLKKKNTSSEWRQSTKIFLAPKILQSWNWKHFKCFEIMANSVSQLRQQWSAKLYT